MSDTLDLTVEAKDDQIALTPLGHEPYILATFAPSKRIPGAIAARVELGGGVPFDLLDAAEALEDLAQGLRAASEKGASV